MTGLPAPLPPNEAEAAARALLERLSADLSPQEQTLSVLQAYLRRLPPDLQAAAWAAAVPHWFDAEILAALLERPAGETAALYAGLQDLPFVEAFEARGGHNVHEVSRAAMLDYLWRERREEYVRLAARAAAYFGERDEPEWQIEHIYHDLIADPDSGVDLLKNTGLTWYGSPLFAYNLVYALAEIALEHVAAGRLSERGQGYANFLSGEIDRIYYRHAEAVQKLELARRFNDSDQQLEANCDLGLGDVARREQDWPQAEHDFQAALAVYRALGIPLNVGLALRRLGGVAEARGDRAGAVRFYEEALQIFGRIGVKDAEYTRADLARVQGEEAE